MTQKERRGKQLAASRAIKEILGCVPRHVPSCATHSQRRKSARARVRVVSAQDAHVIAVTAGKKFLPAFRPRPMCFDGGNVRSRMRHAFLSAREEGKRRKGKREIISSENNDRVLLYFAVVSCRCFVARAATKCERGRVKLAFLMPPE